MANVPFRPPAFGEKISFDWDSPVVPNFPIVGYVEGDGIGPDVMAAARRVWDEAVERVYQGRRRIAWTELLFGEKGAASLNGEVFPTQSVDAIRELGVAIKGPLTTPVGGGHRSLNVSLRQGLDLYANVRPLRHYRGVPSPVSKPELVDVVLFRENTEDVYSGIEYRSGSDEARQLKEFLEKKLGARVPPAAGLGVKPISPARSKRLVRKALQYALDHGRESVTLVHKGNIMKYTEGAFRNWGYELAAQEFAGRVIAEADLGDAAHASIANAVAAASVAGSREPTVVLKDRIADIMFQLMLLRPAEYDVIATTNLNGDYLSDAIAAQVGGIGIAPGANLGDRIAVFEATHGSAPKYAGMNVANPGSLIFSGVMLLEHLGWNEAADSITTAYERVMDRRVVTYDFARLMSGATEVSTSGFADALIDELRKLGPDATPSVTLPVDVKFEKSVRVAQEPATTAPLAAASAGVPPDAMSWVYRLAAERAENQFTGR